jgi:hypothetical protein
MIDFNTGRIEDACMCTTVMIDDDLAELLEQQANELGLPFEEVVNRTVRAGLGTETKPRPRVSVISHKFGFRAGVDLDKLNQLVDEFESRQYAATTAKG